MNFRQGKNSIRGRKLVEKRELRISHGFFLPLVVRMTIEGRVETLLLANLFFQFFVDVAHLFALHLQVALEGLFRLYCGGDALDYADAGRF